MKKPAATNRVAALKRIVPLIKDFEFKSAEFLLRKALADLPTDPDLNALYGTVQAYDQREIEALERLDWGQESKYASKLGGVLVDHFHCRQLMAIKTNRPDPEGFQHLETAQLLHGDPGDVGITLSACLIVKNEEAVLEKCLASIRDLVDEIIVIDTGSTDGTLKIAERFGAKIGSFEWCDDFSAARNAALKMASSRWALWIDADESLPPEHHDLIRSALVRPHYSGFNIPIVNFMSDDNDAEQYVHAPTRLFQLRPGVQFTGRIHEQITPSLEGLGLPWATIEGARIYHEGYRPTKMVEKDKLNRALFLLETEVRENPDDSFQWFNLANAFAVAGRMTEAEHACKASIRTLHLQQPHGATVYQILSEALEGEGRLAEAYEITEEAKSRKLGTLATEFTQASVLMKMGRYDDALRAIDRCLAGEWIPGQQGDYSVYTYKRYVLRGQILTVLKRFEEALEMFEMALNVNPDCAAASYSVATVHEQMGNHAAARAEFQVLMARPGLQTLALHGAGRCCLALGKTRDALKLYERAWRDEPANLDAWVGWVNAAETVGDSSLVLAAFESYAKEREPNAELLINWGRALEESGDQEKALNCYSEAIKRDASNANAYFNCGDLLYRMQQYADAAHLYESGLRQTPMNPQGWFVLGNALAQMNLADGARLAFRQCLALDPNHAAARNNLEYVAESFPHAV